MAIPIPMPSLSPTMTEGKITKWLKKVGDKVSSGEAIAEVETDKSNLEVEVYDDGYLLQIVVDEDATAPVGSPIGWIGEKGEKVDPEAAKAAGGGEEKPAEAAAPAAKDDAPKKDVPKAQPAAEPSAPAKASPPKAAPLTAARREPSSDGRLRVSPVARRIAREQGLELGDIAGTGPLGRIIKRDVEQALEQQPAPKAAAKPRGAEAPAFIPVPFGAERKAPEAKPITSMRKVIAERMAEVKPGVPHFYLTIEVEMDEAMKAREQAKALELKVSVNDLIVKAAAIALRRTPQMNVTLDGDQVLHYSTVDVGIAVAMEGGLITPVIRDADQKGLAAIGAESRDLAKRARDRKLRPEEYTGGTLAVSNLGMYGIDSFIAVINPPHAAILAVGQVAERAVVRDGALVVRQMMSITLSGDHRVIDGAVGAEYLRELRGLLEHPMRLLF